MTFASFVQEFGAPQQGSAVNLEMLQLDHSPALKQFVAEVGGGSFADGLISLVSVRENIESLDGWRHWLPPGSRLFGCSAFGLLMITRGNDVWIVETQYGEIVESDFTITEFICELANPETRDNILRKPLFHLWKEMGGELPPKSVLCPTPALPLGGHWSVDTLSIMTLPVYLSITGQIFGPGGEMPAEVRLVNG